MDLTAHSRFFDALVDLVPARHYLEGAEDKVVNLKYMKKSARDEARAAFKQQHKAVKRAQLDPDTAKTTLELQKEAAAKQAAQQAANGAAESDDDSEGGGSDSGSDGEGGERQQQQQPGRDGLQVGQLAIASKPASREELRERLQKKLEEMRKQRKAEEAASKAADAKAWREKSLQEGRNKVAGAAGGGQKRKGGEQQAQQQQQGQKQQQQQQQQQKKRQRQSDGGEGDALAFNKLDFGSDPRQQRKKAKKQSKQQLLETAQEKQTAAADLGATEEGKAQLQKEAWGAALQRAKGDKVFDDPRLLKKSMKKEAKMKAKKAAVWQDRLKHQAQEQKAKQQKRKDNIDTRVKAKQDRRKQKRENKLLRAGFEGRKAGFIATPGKAAAAGGST
ncbi:surfeit locus 6-like protein [Micractinium conductrix]|uniref:Surfeit locus 6-like protein n=1 Tax=Micractinium conductrix TaxID=554055 RepID=A0A2P6V3J4_9CHLO|nr:surfeit locus 6-like protein [Micractinium conductrix]|eukprot:PSC68647.1 surfeit locus 6-like protein [Micractinium conductrix]